MLRDRGRQLRGREELCVLSLAVIVVHTTISLFLVFTCVICLTVTRSAVKPSYIRCPHCCRIAGSQACIRQHISTSADGDSTVYSCRLCEFTCTRLSAIRRHVTSHIQDVSDCDLSRIGGTGEDNSADTCDSGEIACRSMFWCRSADM